MSHTVYWEMTFNQIHSLEKINRTMGGNLRLKTKEDSAKDLRIISKDGEEKVLKSMDKRDQAFSQIIGFSDAAWQVVW
jgi:hypothetical protein